MGAPAAGRNAAAGTVADSCPSLAPWWAEGYITEAGARGVLRYRYSGCDNSFMYRYFCSPLAEALVRRLMPMWVAPNLITCAGLVPSLLAHVVIWCYCPDLLAPCPRWCWALTGACTFIYQTVDNMDGKQARRTGTSSPLGLLIDHGADALNIVLSALNVMAMLQVGDSPLECVLIWLASAAPFYFATWEEFHTGSLYLGVFNGPTDGVLILSASQFLCSVVGDYTAWWRAEALPGLGLSRKSCTIGFYLVCVAGTVLANFVAVGRACKDWRHFRGAVLLTAPFCCMCLAGGSAWLLVSATGSRAFSRHPRLAFWLLGLAFLKLAIHLQLAHICDEPYRPWMLSLLLPAVLLACSALAGSCWVGLHPEQTWDDEFLLLGCAVALAASCLHLVVGATLELAAVLGQRVFSIPHKPSAKRS